MRIILLRHAKAVGHDEAPSDRERGLTDRGRREALAAGEAIRAAGLAPDVAIVSPARRTQETWAIAASAFAGPVRETAVEAAYEADAEALWALLGAETGETRIIVGHNPSLLDLAGHLIDRSQDGSAAGRAVRSELQTAAWAAFACEPSPFDYVAPTLITYWRPSRD